MEQRAQSKARFSFVESRQRSTIGQRQGEVEHLLSKEGTGEVRKKIYIK